MAQNQVGSIQKLPLPATRDAMIAQRTMLPHKTLNDYVDEIHIELWSVEKDVVQDGETVTVFPYRELLDAVSDEDAVEGSLAIDNAKAAEMIRDYAIEHGISYVSKKKLMTIVKSLNVVMRRYHMSRKERAVTVNGEVVGSGE